MKPESDIILSNPFKPSGFGSILSKSFGNYSAQNPSVLMRQVAAI
jgi:hypothetical protein